MFIDCLFEARKGRGVFNNKRQRIPEADGGRKERVEMRVLG